MLQWGIVGTSFISETLAEAIKGDPGSTLQAVAGRRPEAIDAFARKYGINATFADYSALIRDPEVEIVYIGLPNHLHHRYILECVAAGKHVLSEKSLTIDMEKTSQIVAAVTDADNLFVEGLMYLHHPLIERLVMLLNDGVIGNVKTITGQYCADIAQFVNAEGKGAIYNLGCYPVSLLHLVLQTACGDGIWSDFSLTGSGSLSPIDGNVCDASMNLSLPNGVTARLHTAETYGMFADFVVVGDEGTLRMVTNPWLPEETNTILVHRYEDEPEFIDVRAAGDAFYYQVMRIRERLALGEVTLARPAPRPNDSQEIMQILTRWEAACLS